ncbi:MAG: glycosyltransferase family 39 protein [bacterium]|nr:glycosyltransferase family 39 protein [bacterium]
MGRLRFVRHQDKEPAEKKIAVPEDTAVKYWEILTVIFVFVILAGLNYIWVLRDMTPPFEHSGRSIQESVLLYHRFLDGRGIAPNVYPPLSYIVSAGFYYVFGVSKVTAISSQLVFLIPYLFGAWWLGRELGGKSGGLLVLLASAGNPWMSLHCRGYFLEVGMTAMAAVALALLCASKNCAKPKTTICLGIALGLGMLSKWAFIFFVAPAMIIPFIQAWKEGGHSRIMAVCAFIAPVLMIAALWLALNTSFWDFPRKSYTLASDVWVFLGIASFWLIRKKGWSTGSGLALAFTIAYLISGWWYFLSLQELRVKAFGDFGQGYDEKLSMIILWGTLLNTYWIAPIWFACGFAYGVFKRDMRALTLALTAGIAAGLLFYWISRVPPGPRYMLPGTMMAMVIGVAWLGRFRYVKWPAAIILAFVSLLQIAFYLLPFLGPWNYFTRSLNAESHDYWSVPYIGAPDSEGIPIDSLTKRIIQELDKTGESRITAMISPNSRFDVDMLMLDALLKGRIIDIEHFLPGRSVFKPKTALLLAVGDENTDFLRLYHRLKDYEILQTWEHPKWGVWVLYKHPTQIDNRPLPGVTDGPPIPQD